jgi:ribosomal protein S18 acetylase RimI-like enzyme
MKIEKAKHTDPDLLEGINALLPQLSGPAKLLNEAELREILHSGTTHLLVARQDGKLYGMLTLAIFRIPTCICGLVEDVVVDEAIRGYGLGKMLLEAAIELARAEGAQQLDLTSRPSREAANRLYQNLGFEKRDTNVYRLVL